MKERIRYIDGLRALAALAVVAFHGAVHAPVRPDASGLLGIALRAGAHGVDLFFVLSGFCLAYPFLLNRKRAGVTGFEVRAFAARRLVRILPPYYLAIALLIAVALALRSARIPLPTSVDAASFAPDEVLKQMLFIGKHYSASPFWTLALEFRWYFLFPVALWLWTRSRLAFGLLAAVSLIASETQLHSYDLFFLPVFMLGIVAADIQICQHRVARFAAVALLPFLAAAITSTQYDGWYFAERDPSWGIAMFCLVVAAGASPSARAILSQRCLGLLGAASYSIYLIHEPAIELGVRLLQTLKNDFAVSFLSVVLALGAGMLFWLIAERPFVKMGIKTALTRRIERFLSVPSALPPLNKVETPAPVAAYEG